jgi:hypothetical protein
MIEAFTSLANEAITLARLVGTLVAIVSVLAVWWMTRALIPVIGACLVAGIALFAISPAGMATLEGWIASDVGDTTAEEGFGPLPTDPDSATVGTNTGPGAGAGSVLTALIR